MTRLFAPHALFRARDGSVYRGQGKRDCRAVVGEVWERAGIVGSAGIWIVDFSAG
jgi:hypothetical protein